MNLKTTNMTFLNNQIKTKRDIATYITDLYDRDMLYHFDDDANNIESFTKAFTKAQCKLIDKRRDEMLAINYDYAFECALSFLEH